MTQPEIRFNGFTDEWNTSVLGDVLKIPAKIEAKVKSNSDLLTVKLHGGGVHQMSSNKVLSIGATKYYARKAGQLIYGKQNFFNGSIAIIPKELDGKASSGDVPVFDVIDADSIFLYQKLSQPSFYERTKDLASGTGSKRLHEKTIQRLPIQLPTLPEQQKIGALFSKYDAIISLREQKFEELNALKKGMLQQMFPKNDAKIPELRFSGFNDVWVEKKLGEMFDIKRGKVLAKTDVSLMPTSENKYPVYSSQTKDSGLMGYTDTWLFEDGITWTTDGANAGTVAYRSGKFFSTNVNGVLLKKAGVSNRFVAIAFGNVAKNHVTYIANPKLMSNVVSGIKIQLPTLPEQQKIGQLFKQLDARISNEQSKIEQLKAQKQGLLQKMIS